ncbi:MAG: hypothetical protein CV087_19440 [Candidatus Brocadia sp. WS118]|nr:MAG: hypothetical protein CV087_19440 [Candidatus Brocadia sp. WS118]
MMKTDEPLLYYKTKVQIEEYRKKPALEKLKWLEVHMEYFHKAMPEKAKRIREKFFPLTVSVVRDSPLKTCPHKSGEGG